MRAYFDSLRSSILRMIRTALLTSRSRVEEYGTPQPRTEANTVSLGGAIKTVQRWPVTVPWRQ